jgi:hypothetical protein
LFGYQATPHHRSDSDSGEDQLARYIELINREDLDADDQFDACFRSEFDKLWPLFSRLWCVPATSAPVERIFSQSGITDGLGACVTSVNKWCASKRLQLNTKKTEVMWFGSATNLRKIPSADKDILVGSDIISPSNVVRDLGVFFDSELNMKSHISRIVCTCFYHLRRLRTVRSLLGQEITARLVSAFVLSRLDYCNALLAELPASTLAPLQRVMHAAARLVRNLLPRDHVTSAMKLLHWLPVKQRVDFKLCLLVHLAINGRAPTYLNDLIKTTASVPGRASNRSASNNDLVIQRTRLKLGERAFSVAAPRIWNQLPSDLKATTDTVAFKRKLKTYLFSAAYNQ